MQNWYLMTPKTRPNITGGFENDGFNDYNTDAFEETLMTDIADDVIVYNHDLSESFECRCVISGRTSNTTLKTMQREMLFSIGTIKAGMYVFYNGGYWLIAGMPDNNKIYEKAISMWCQYCIRWQDKRGKIIERWVNGVTASKYDIGESGNKTMVLATNNFTLLTPNDEECQLLDEKRVFIDIKSKSPTKVYKITRDDDILYDYGINGGVLSFVVNRTEFNPDADNQDLRIADYFSPTTEDDNQPDDNGVISFIEGKREIVYGSSRTFTALFVDEDDIELSGIDYNWNIVSDLGSKISFTENSSTQTIKIKIDNDEELIDSSFLLQLIIDNVVVSEVQVLIKGLF